METPVNAPFKEKLRIEAAKLREMTFKNKLEYIWEYYKFHIAFTAIALFIIVSLLNAWIINPASDTVLFISWNRGFVTDEQSDRLKNHLEERLVGEDAREEVVITPFFFTGDDPMTNMAEVQRTVAMLAAEIIDLFITDHALLEDYSRIGYILPFDQVLAEIQEKNPEAYSRIEENIVTALFEIDEGVTESKTAGVKISGSPLLLKHGIFRQDLYISIAVTTGRIETIIETLILFFE